MTWQVDLITRYPLLFRSESPKAASGYPQVGNGWRSTIEKAVERIDAAVGELVRDTKAIVRVTEIKQKYGGLRIDVDRTLLPAEVEAKLCEAIDLAEARADSTCEVCGDIGKLYERDDWLLTRCERHAEGNPVLPQHSAADVQIEYAIVDGTKRAISSRRYDRELDAFVDAPLPFEDE